MKHGYALEITEDLEKHWEDFQEVSAQKVQERSNGIRTSAKRRGLKVIRTREAVLPSCARKWTFFLRQPCRRR